MNKLVQALSLAFFFAFTSAADTCGSDSHAKVLQHIFKNSNKDIRPPPGTNRTVVSANMDLSRVYWVDEKRHQISIDINFHARWTNPSLQYQKIIETCPNFNYISILTEEGVGKLWKPDIFFPLEVEGKAHNLFGRNQLIRVYPNGDVLYSIHAKTTLYCTGIGSLPGELKCRITFGTYGLRKHDLVLKWNDQNAIQVINSKILLEDYVLGDVISKEQDLTQETGTYTMLVAEFHFIRKACLA